LKSSERERLIRLIGELRYTVILLRGLAEELLNKLSRAEEKLHELEREVVSEK
jgi:hypothetical protein